MLELVLTRCTSECRRANAFYYSVSGFLKTYLVRLCIYSDWPYFYGAVSVSVILKDADNTDNADDGN